MKVLSLAALSMLMLASCASKSDTQTSASASANNTEVQEKTIDGNWLISSIIVNDTLSVVPAEATPDEPSFMNFFKEEGRSRFSAKTNCNNIFGSVEINGDSIKFGEFGATRMACPDMTVEDMLGVVLPEITAIEFVNDSTVNLTAPDGKTINLRKAADQQ